MQNTSGFLSFEDSRVRMSKDLEPKTIPNCRNGYDESQKRDTKNKEMH
jgi:hypothetical protein